MQTKPRQESKSKKRLLPQPPRLPPLERAILQTRPTTQQPLKRQVRPRLMPGRRLIVRRSIGVGAGTARLADEQAGGSAGGCRGEFHIHLSSSSSCNNIKVLLLLLFPPPRYLIGTPAEVVGGAWYVAGLVCKGALRCQWCQRSVKLVLSMCLVGCDWWGLR